MGKKLVIKGADWMMDAANVETIGEFYPSLSGLQKASLAFTYVYKKPLPAGRVFFYYQSETDGSALFNFKLFNKSGDTLTQATYVEKYVTKNTWVDLELTATEGQYFGAFGGDAGICYTSGLNDKIPHFSAKQGNQTEVDYKTDFDTWFSFVVAIKTEV